jgi:hypothetical protein
VRRRAEGKDGGEAAFFDSRIFHGHILTQFDETCNGFERKHRSAKAIFL